MQRLVEGHAHAFAAHGLDGAGEGVPAEEDAVLSRQLRTLDHGARAVVQGRFVRQHDLRSGRDVQACLDDAVVAQGDADTSVGAQQAAFADRDLLLAAAGAAALLLDPGFWGWWLSVGLTRICSFLMDVFFELIYLGQDLNLFWLLGPALGFILLEIAALKKLKSVEEY